MEHIVRPCLYRPFFLRRQSVFVWRRVRALGVHTCPVLGGPAYGIIVTRRPGEEHAVGDWSDGVRHRGSATRKGGHVGTRYFGASVARVEDPRLLRGSGRFVDDIKLPGLLHAALVRSPHAHARIIAVQLEAARALPSVAGVFGYEDLAGWMRPMPSAGLPPPVLEA